jgi:uncharacterized protein
MPEAVETGGGGTVTKEAQNWAMLCHLTALTAFIGVPLGHILGPLICWLLKKEEYPLVDRHGKEALNFQISMTIYAVVSGVLILAVIGFVLLPAVLIADIVLTIIASVKVANGESYRYPLTIRLLK